MRKALLTLTQNAVKRLRFLEKDGDLLRIGTKKKGCSGLSYSLDIIKEKNKFDEIVEQDGVKVVIESKALFTLIGSEMDYEEDRLSSKFTFKNPNIKEMCGCGESFMT
jgi:iron-sulfur cluster assembly protein